MGYGQLDFLYMPSGDVAAEAEAMCALGGELVFAIEAYDSRVAMVRLGEGPPDLLLADHVEGERPILVYRVDDLASAAEDLRSRGLEPGPAFGIPHGTCHTFTVEGGHRIAIYEALRPNATEHFAGRRDF